MARWQLRPTQADRWVAGRVAKHASPATQRFNRVVTLAADERPLCAIAAVVWLTSRLGTSSQSRKAADHLALTVLVTTAVPHILKGLVDQERPDRCMVHGARHGIPRSGEPYDAFPSGHAMHVGAMASALSHFFPRMSPLIWMAGGMLAATRVVLLAHWMSDVLVGFAAGVVIERLLRPLHAVKHGRRRKANALLSHVHRRQGKDGSG